MMSLDQWLQNGWLQQFEPSVAEIQKSIEVIDRNLSDAEAQGLSADGRFQHAYDAALPMTILALKASGYVVRKGQSHHKHSIDSLRYTLGPEWSETADHLERCSRLRGQSVYEQIGLVSDDDATDLLASAKQLRNDLITWLKENYPDLVPPHL
jgi:hypothetical protein